MQKQPNMLIAFVQELFQRFAAKSPKFFRIWQWITAIATAITGIPEALEYFGVKLPASLATFENKFVAAVSTGMFIMSALTTQSKAVQNKDCSIAQFGGQVLKQTDAKVLPFTAASEEKKADENKATL